MRDFERVEEKLVEEMTLDQIFSRAQKVIQKEEIKSKDFEYLYGEKNVEEDEKYVKEMEEKFEKELEEEERKPNRLAKIFEAIIYQHGELSDWFGNFAFMIKPSRYDTIENKVHNIVEFQKEESLPSYLALAVDATFGTDIQDKFERIKNEIDKGKLAKVKYFYSETLGMRGELKSLPRVIIGAEPKTVKELGELWIHGKNKDLGEHPIQFQMLEEILIQAKAFAKHAQEEEQINIAEVYKRTAGIIEEILKEKKKTLKDDGERDNVFYCIKHLAESFGGE